MKKLLINVTDELDTVLRSLCLNEQGETVEALGPLMERLLRDHREVKARKTKLEIEWQERPPNHRPKKSAADGS